MIMDIIKTDNRETLMEEKSKGAREKVNDVQNKVKRMTNNIKI